MTSGRLGLGSADLAVLELRLRWMLPLDEDLAPFHSLLAR